MQKLLLLLFISLGLIGSSFSSEFPPSDEQRLDRLNNRIADILAVREETTKIYWMEVNELIEKRKLLSPESNQEEIDEIIKLATDAEKKCSDAFWNYQDESEILDNAKHAILYYQEYDQAIVEAKNKLEEVINRCSLSIDESCDAKVKAAAVNFYRAKEKRIAAEPTYYKLDPKRLLNLFCPSWKILYSKSLEEITDSDS